SNAPANSQGEGRRVLGELLLEQGIVSQADIEDALADQLAETVYRTSLESDGSFVYKVAGYEPPGSKMVVKLRIDEVVLRGMARVEDMSHLGVGLLSFRQVPLLATGVLNLRELDLPPEEWKMLSLIDGRRNLDEITMAGNLTRFSTARALFNLLGKRLVEIGIGASPPPVQRTAAIQAAKPTCPPFSIFCPRGWPGTSSRWTASTTAGFPASGPAWISGSSSAPPPASSP
ncbi:MAG: hypothetical protein NTW26_01800, partial [bacterium]|nr:hypothetical protein [bacterium]